MATPLDALEQLRTDPNLDAFCRDHGVALLVAFGSAAAGDEAARDLDLAVLLTDEADLAEVTASLMAWTGATVDVLDLRRAGPVARARALGPGSVPLHESVAGTFARRQMAALAQELDTRWILDLGLETLGR